MADEPKKASERFSGWKKAVDDNDASVGGAQGILKKALALNPSLKGELSTQEFLDDLAAKQSKDKQDKKQVAERAADASPAVDLMAAPAQQTKLPTAQTLGDLTRELKPWVAQEQQRLATEQKVNADARAAETKARAEISQATAKALVELIARLDPTMLSPKTQLLLSDEAAFLREVGFHPDAVKARVTGKR